MSAKCANTSSRTSVSCASRCCLSAQRTAASSLSWPYARTASAISAGTSLLSNTRFSLPTLAFTSSWNATIFLISSWAAIGPAHGISEIDNAADAPIMPQMAGSQSWSTDITVATTCTSLRTPLSNNGRIGRSIKRLFKIADSGGRASRLIKPPGKRPIAYIFSS